jgi:hypothetical protein
VADALWMNCPVTGGAPQYTAAELRQDMAFGGAYGGRALGARQGVRPGGSQWQVSVAGTTVSVAPGVGLVDPGLSAPQGPYWVALPAQEDHALTPAHATSPRKDIVVVRVYDHDEDASGLKLARSEYLAGVPGPSPSEPAVPAGAVRVATIDVPASGGGSPAVTVNAPYSVAPGGILPVRNAAEQAAVVAAPGMVLARLDTPALWLWTGAAWAEAGQDAPYCILARTTAQAGIGTNAWTGVAWNSETADPYGLHASGSADVTLAKLGLWLLTARISWAVNITGNRGLRMEVNGSPVGGRSFIRTTETSEPSLELAVQFRNAAVTDTVRVLAYQTSGAPLDLTVTEGGPRMELSWLRP